MLVLTLMRRKSLPILAQLYYIWMYTGKHKWKIVTYTSRFRTLFLLELVLKTLSHRDM